MAAGDMYGINGMDHLVCPGMLRRVFAGSLPSGPSNKRPPAIRNMIDDGAVEAYNIPTGLMFRTARRQQSNPVS